MFMEAVSGFTKSSRHISSSHLRCRLGNTFKAKRVTISRQMQFLKVVQARREDQSIERRVRD